MIKDLQDALNDDSKLTMISKLIIERLDLNRKGYLNKTEVKTFFEDVAEELDTHISSAEFDEVFSELDEDNSMKITHEQIKSMIKQIMMMLLSEIPT